MDSPDRVRLFQHEVALMMDLPTNENVLEMIGFCVPNEGKQKKRCFSTFNLEKAPLTLSPGLIQCFRNVNAAWTGYVKKHQCNFTQDVLPWLLAKCRNAM